MQKLVLCLFLLIIYFPSIAYADTVKWINKDSHNNDDKYIELETTNTPGYLKYTNQVYGYTIFVPETFNTVKYFKLLERCNFEKDLTTSFSINVNDNFLNNTLNKQYQDDLVYINKKDIKYTEFGDDWYILIWNDSINTNYKKVFVRNNYITEFDFICPSNKYENYSDVISTIVSNFMPANKKEIKSLESKSLIKENQQHIDYEKSHHLQAIDNTNNTKKDNLVHESSKKDSISNNDFAFWVLIISSIYLIYLFYKMTRSDYKKETNEFLEALGPYFFTLFLISTLILSGLLLKNIVFYIVVFVGSQWIYTKIIEKINRNK